MCIVIQHMGLGEVNKIYLICQILMINLPIKALLEDLTSFHLIIVEIRVIVVQVLYKNKIMICLILVLRIAPPRLKMQVVIINLLQAIIVSSILIIKQHNKIKQNNSRLRHLISIQYLVVINSQPRIYLEWILNLEQMLHKQLIIIRHQMFLT